jgi:FAD/FMN-containing dehydrogenase
VLGQFGGSISAEHGIGQLRRAELQHRKPAAELALMRKIKRLIDPDNLMNPGKLV